jgi:nicotinamidase-related amidase
MTGRAALLVVDVQTAMFDEADPVSEGDALLGTLKVAIAKAREAGAAVIYVRHDSGPGKFLEKGTPGWGIHPAIQPVAGDVIVDKKTPDSFHETTLQEELEARGITKLVVAGIQTEVCVDTTCRRAFSLGYAVTLVKDAHSTWDSRSLSARQIIDHHNEVLGWFAKVQDLRDVEFQGDTREC